MPYPIRGTHPLCIREVVACEPASRVLLRFPAVQRRLCEWCGFNAGRLLLTLSPRRTRTVGWTFLIGSSAVAATATWSVHIGSNPPNVDISGVAQDGLSLLSDGCSLMLGEGFRGALHNYMGDSLARTDDDIEPVVFEFRGVHSGIEIYLRRGDLLKLGKGNAGARS